MAGNTVVNLEPVNSSFKLGYDEVKNFGNISLTDGSIIFAQSGGDISINARELVIDDRATLITAGLGGGNAGNINLNVSESIKIVGTGLEQFEDVLNSIILSQELNPINTLQILQEGTGVFSATLGEGAAGNIAIDTSQLQLIEGGIIGSSTIETGASGSIIINATDSVEIIGSGIFSSPLIGSTGNGNFLEINTVFLTISDGGFISTSTFGQGNGNDIFINALEEIDIRRINNSGSTELTVQN
ncbi:MAG: hypothetical protein QNJ32_29325 [Xenococcaceae cyanobacterium MO_167.B27]|nr:hypothetical protein [Xenococcaceae cyanobacterium MO_167.B27]